MKGTARDNSIVSLSGSSQQALAANNDRNFLLIQNTGNANAGANICGGSAAIAGTGTITLSAGTSLLFDAWVPADAVNVIGTAGQPLTVIEG